MLLRQLRLVIKTIDVTHPAGHEQKNNPLGLGSNRSEPRINRPRAGTSVQQTRQRQPAKATSHILQQLAARSIAKMITAFHIVVAEFVRIPMILEIDTTEFLRIPLPLIQIPKI